MRDDVAFNVQFIELIRENPCLYDRSRRDYNIRNVHDMVWQSISESLQEPVTECKDRWKNLRGRYLKYIKYVNSPNDDKKPVKEYYLAEHMSFLLNFLKTRPNKRKPSQALIKTQPQSSDYEDESFTSHAFVATEFQPDFGDETVPTETPVQPSPDEEDETTLATMTSENRTFRNMSRKYMVARRKKTLSPLKSVEDPDLSFLKSVLPDMKFMTSDQKRRFKIGVLSLAGQILYENSTADRAQGQASNGQLFSGADALIQT